jgi:hypothetical protein
MSIQVKKQGSYSSIIGMSVKKSGIYTAVVGCFVKKLGVYQNYLLNTIGQYNLESSLVKGSNTYTVSDGDEFTTQLDIIGPSAPFGKYTSTRSYVLPTSGQYSRGSTGLRGYDVDPLHTGYEDSNMGVKKSSWSDSMVQTSGKLTLKSRVATADEQSLFIDSTVAQTSAMINSASSLVFTAPFFIEANYSTFKTASLSGFHNSFWLMQMGPTRTATNTEIDWEGTSNDTSANWVNWVSGTGTTTNPTDPSPVADTNDAAFHKRGIEVDPSGIIRYWLDGIVHRSFAPPAGQTINMARPFYFLMTNHVVSFGTDTYNAADWVAAGSGGAVATYDYVMVARGGGAKYVPQIAPVTINVDFNTAFTQVLSTTTALWGGATSETVESYMVEGNEPGGNYAGGYSNLASGLAYNASTFTLSGTISDKSGRLNLVRYATATGSSCQPHRIALNVGPNIVGTSLTTAAGGSSYSFNLYKICDCGVLTSDASGNRSKLVSVTGLPSGLTYSDVTGLITGTAPTTNSTNNITVSTTNSIGQSATKVLTLTVQGSAGAGVVAPTLSSGTLDQSFDFDNTASMSLTSGSINSISGVDGTSLTLTNTGGTARPVQTLVGARYAAQFSTASSQYLQSTTAQAAGGTTVIIFNPTTNTANQAFYSRSKASATSLLNREDLLGIVSGGSSGFVARKCNASTTTEASTNVAPYPTGLRIIVVLTTPGGTTSTMYLDGKGTPISVSGTSDAVGMDTVSIGCRAASSANTLFMDGYVYRVLHYSNALSASDIEAVAVWAKTNYGTANLA